ncbi:hypothetical protein LVY74_08055 [Acinetobacter sp. ME22]|uniref:hypothetical protein n=1 Tax=Acinetobacter sp. ME22 TaxID=2904802 RepID=UPI001EDB69B7|nr:hypothetical protein [Acinetobacter sp. ME22]MCG2573511.1 hypothetical protein [Acinetobacter sp. ME22]
MKKFYIVIGGLCAALLVFLLIQAQQPDADEIARYQAILCFVIRQPQAPHDLQQLRAKMRQIQQGSIPDYAFQQPEFRSTLANQWIEAYFALSKTQQTQARRSYPECVAAFAQQR